MLDQLSRVQQYLTLSESTTMLSKRLIASYVLDWVFIIVIAAVGGSLKFVQPRRRPFSLLDLNISFPFVPQSISITTLFLVGLVAPAIIIALVTLLLVPAKSIRQTFSRSQLWRRKLWELHTGLAGLALSLVLAFFVTQGLKNIFGKPRPHLLALCEPNLANLSAHVVGGFGQPISDRWTLVDSSICAQQNGGTLDDGFRSFPSGHASFSWSGLLYLSLFLCAKFSIVIPHLPYSTNLGQAAQTELRDAELLPLHHHSRQESSSQSKSPTPPPDHQASTPPPNLVYNQAAAPPVYGTVIVLIPLGAAAYITSTRYSEFWHFGFDVIAGALIGIVSAWIGFRWYHLPINRGQGWAWGPRSIERAFGIGVGTGGYVGPEGTTHERRT